MAEHAIVAWNTRPALVTDEVVERVAEQMHYAACAFGADTTAEIAAQQFPWEVLDDHRREGVRCMARAALAATPAIPPQSLGDPVLVELRNIDLKRPSSTFSADGWYVVEVPRSAISVRAVDLPR